MSRVSTGLVIDEGLMQSLEEWAQAEFRSRNKMIEMILAQAVNNRGKPYPAPVESPADADMDTADLAQVAALGQANAALVAA